MSSRLLARKGYSATALRLASFRKGSNALTTQSNRNGGEKWERSFAWVVGGGLAVLTLVGSSRLSTSSSTTSLDAIAMKTVPLRLNESSDIHERTKGAQDEESQNEVTQERETGIFFSQTFDSKLLLGCGVRKKYHVFNVYAVGFYIDPQDFQGITDEEEFEKALLDPHKHRTIRLVFNRAVTMRQVIDTLKDSLEPRMHGEDLHTLKEFSKLRDHGALKQGDEVILTIKGPFIETKCTNGGVGVVNSEVFTRAVNDVYFGKDPISPPAKASALEGKKRLLH